MKKKTAGLLAVFFAVGMLAGCTDAEIKDAQKEAEDVAAEVADQAQNLTDMDNECVQSVKTGHFKAHPQITLGEAFDSFFGTPTWKYLEGEDGEKIVEFTGYFMYREAEVKARIQFPVSEDGTFNLGAVSYNDVPQEPYIADSLIQKVFEDAESAAGIENVAELISYLGSTATDFYNQADLQLEPYGLEEGYSGYDGALSVSEVRDGSGYYIRLNARQLGEQQVSLAGLRVGDVYEEVKSVIIGTSIYVSDEAEDFEVPGGDKLTVKYDATGIITEIAYGHFPQQTAGEETSQEDFVSVENAAGEYQSGTITIKVSIYSDVIEGDDSIGIISWSDSAAGESAEVTLYKTSEFDAAFMMNGMSYQLTFYENGASLCEEGGNVIASFEKTMSYMS